MKAQAIQDDIETTQNSKLKTQNSQDETWAEMPDLILIDGGIGQLNGALEVLRELGFEHIPTVGVVKGVNRDRFDLLLPGATELIVLKRDSAALRSSRRSTRRPTASPRTITAACAPNPR